MNTGHTTSTRREHQRMVYRTGVYRHLRAQVRRQMSYGQVPGSPTYWEEAVRPQEIELTLLNLTYNSHKMEIIIFQP